MKELKEVLPGILMVKPLIDASDFVVRGNSIFYRTPYWGTVSEELPVGKWEIVGIVSECSEELKSLALSNGFTETDLIIKKIEG